MQIVQAPHPVLSEKAKPIITVTKEIKEFIEYMKKLLLEASDPEGVGLAAPQAGKALQLFLTKPTKKSPVKIYINPRLTLLSESDNHKKMTDDPDEVQLEGCLSLKDIWGTVRRVPKVEITYMDELGQMHTEKAKGFTATILQHEFDHLQGILFPRRVIEQNGTLYKSHKDKNGDDIFDPISV